MQPDMFDDRAGFRTLSTLSSRFTPVSYHNGSIWPHDSALVAEGFERFGFVREAQQARMALYRLFSVFQTPIEFVVIEDELVCRGRDRPGGQKACLEQAWSAAAMVTEMGKLLDDLDKE
jgi:glycogen debranching enzyme